MEVKLRFSTWQFQHQTERISSGFESHQCTYEWDYHPVPEAPREKILRKKVKIKSRIFHSEAKLQKIVSRTPRNFSSSNLVSRSACHLCTYSPLDRAENRRRKVQSRKSAITLGSPQYNLRMDQNSSSKIRTSQLREAG